MLIRWLLVGAFSYGILSMYDRIIALEAIVRDMDKLLQSMVRTHGTVAGGGKTKPELKDEDELDGEPELKDEDELDGEPELKDEDELDDEPELKDEDELDDEPKLKDEDDLDDEPEPEDDQ